MNTRTLPQLSDRQLLKIVHNYQCGGFTQDSVFRTRYQDAVKALHERGYIVDLATETQESEAVKKTDTFPAVHDTD